MLNSPFTTSISIFICVNDINVTQIKSGIIRFNKFLIGLFN